MIDSMEGKRFGKYTVIRRCNVNSQKVVAVCDCGRERTLFANGVKQNSRGCPRCSRLSMTGVGFKERHGMYQTAIYRTWQKMISRCSNPNNPRYAAYGGRGIVVSEEWRTFENFYHDMGEKPSPKHSLDRIDNNSGYCKENCRWATGFEQYRNRRGNVFVEVLGKRMIFSDAMKFLGLNSSTVRKFITKHKITDPQVGLDLFLQRRRDRGQ